VLPYFEGKGMVAFVNPNSFGFDTNALTVQHACTECRILYARRRLYGIAQEQKTVSLAFLAFGNVTGCGLGKQVPSSILAQT